MAIEVDHSVEVGGRKLAFHVTSGAVAGVHKRSETHVEVSVSQYSSRASSTLVNTTEFALIGADCVERPHWFSSHDFFIRDGNRVSLIHASYESTRWAYIVNHDTRQAFNAWYPASFVYSIGLLKPSNRWLVGLPIFLIATVGSAGNPLIGAIAAFAAVWIARVLRERKANRAWQQHLYPQFEAIKARLLDVRPIERKEPVKEPEYVSIRPADSGW